MEKLLDGIGFDLRCLGKGEGGPEFFMGWLKKSASVFVAAWLAWNLLFDGVLEGIAFSALCSALALAFFASGPRRQLDLRARKIEMHLPFALMQLSAEQNIGIPFAQSLQRLAESDYGELSAGLGIHLSKARICGSSVPEALLLFAGSNRSRLLKRAMSQVVSAYEHGNKEGAGEPMRGMALELLARQKSEAKEFSAKIGTFSVAFVVVSAVMPALFCAYLLVGSSFMEVPFDAASARLIIAALFPAIDIAMLLLARSMAPEFLKGGT